MRGDGSSNEERPKTGRRYRTDRTEGISDGVFAASPTLLNLDVRPPEGGVSPTTDKRRRSKDLQEMCYHLRTTWRAAPIPREDDGLFPLSILAQTKRGYLVTVGRQMNGSYTMSCTSSRRTESASPNHSAQWTTSRSRLC